MSIAQNTTNLQELLEIANNLPEASSSANNISTCMLDYNFSGTVLFDRYVNGEHQHVYHDTRYAGSALTDPVDIETGEVINDITSPAVSNVVCGSIVTINAMSDYIISTIGAELLYTQAYDDSKSMYFFKITASEGETAQIEISYPA